MYVSLAFLVKDFAGANWERERERERERDKHKQQRAVGVVDVVGLKLHVYVS